MRHLLVRSAVLFALAFPAWVAAQQGAVDARAPHTFVIRDLGWAADANLARDVDQIASGASADFVLLSAREVVQQQRSGKPGKVVFVLSRAGGDFQVLFASEHLLSSEPARVQGVVDLFEKARRWMLGNPEAAARMLTGTKVASQADTSIALAARDYRVARPGPALLEALKADAANQSPDLAALLDDSFVRVAVRRLERPAEGMLVSSR